MKLVCCLLFCYLSVRTVSGEVDYNDLVDKIIDEVKQRLVKENKTVILLPEIVKSFTETVLFIPVPGRLTIRGCELGYLSTLRRFGTVNTNATNNKNSITLTVTFKLDVLTINAANFLSTSGIMAKFGFVHTKWDSIRFGDNSFSMTVNIHLNESSHQCSTQLDLARVDRLGDFQVIDWDQGFFSPSTEQIYDIILQWFAPDIENAINKHVHPVALKVIQDLSYEICSNFL